MHKKLLLIGSVLLVVVALATLGSSLGRHPAAAPPPGAGATRDADATLHAHGASLRVGTVTWRVLNSDTSHRIGNQYLAATATGVYLIVEVAATNSTSRPVTVHSDQVKLEASGNEYRPDPGSLTALELGGHRTLSLADLDPTVTATGWIAFDVPPQVIHSDPRVCFGGLGIGAASGCIAAA